MALEPSAVPSIDANTPPTSRSPIKVGPDVLVLLAFDPHRSGRVEPWTLRTGLRLPLHLILSASNQSLRPSDSIMSLSCGKHQQAVVGLTLDVKETRQCGSEFGPVGHGPLEEFRCLAVVVSSMNLAEANTTDGIGSRDSRKDRSTGGHTSKLVPSGFIKDRYSDFKIGTRRGKSHETSGSES